MSIKYKKESKIGKLEDISGLDDYLSKNYSEECHNIEKDRIISSVITKIGGKKYSHNSLSKVMYFIIFMILYTLVIGYAHIYVKMPMVIFTLIFSLPLLLLTVGFTTFNRGTKVKDYDSDRFKALISFRDLLYKDEHEDGYEDKNKSVSGGNSEYIVQFDMASFTKRIDSNTKESEVDRLIKDFEDSGIGSLVNELNTLYQLENGLPVRLYSMVYIKEGILRVSSDLYTIPKEDSYKKLLVPEIEEDDVLNLYKTLKEDYNNDNKYKKYSGEIKKIEDSKEDLTKAVNYLGEYTELLKESEIGLNKNKKEWDKRVEDGIKESSKLNEENINIVNKVKK